MKKTLYLLVAALMLTVLSGCSDVDEEGKETKQVEVAETKETHEETEKPDAVETDEKSEEAGMTENTGMAEKVEPKEMAEEPEEVAQKETVEPAGKSEKAETEDEQLWENENKEKTEQVSKPAEISVAFVADLNEISGEYDTYYADNMQGSPMIAFKTDSKVTAFSINRIEYDYSNNGQEHIFETITYEYGDLNPDKTLAVKMSIPEGIPEYCISYVDTDGIKKSFTVLQSGETGEFFLNEITVEQ